MIDWHDTQQIHMYFPRKVWTPGDVLSRYGSIYGAIFLPSFVRS